MISIKKLNRFTDAFVTLFLSAMGSPPVETGGRVESSPEPVSVRAPQLPVAAPHPAVRPLQAADPVEDLAEFVVERLAGAAAHAVDADHLELEDNLAGVRLIGVD